MSPRQSLGTLYAQRLWQLNLQSEGSKNTSVYHLIKLNTTVNSLCQVSGINVFCFCLFMCVCGLTFALQALPEEASEEPLAVLAHCWPRVRVHSERVRHLHFAHQHLVQVNGSARVEAPGITRGPWLKRAHRKY